MECVVSEAKRQMKLGLNLVGAGAHSSGWRMPDAREDCMDFPFWKRLVQDAERAKFHFMFWADGAAVRHHAKDDEELSYNSRIDVFEPLTLLSALSAVTSNIGYIATASTTYNEPFNLARKLASLDYITGGRVGWNVVTSWSEQEALNFNRDKHMEHSTRYKRAEEFMDVCRGLWDSWEDDAFIRDKATGQYFDPAKLHNLDHKGEWFKVHGPMNVARPIQGYPVIAQAGSSGPGQDLAARNADLIYTSQKSLDEAQAFYKSVKDRFSHFGRDPRQALVMPGMIPIMGKTMQEAQDHHEQLQMMIHPKVGLPSISQYFENIWDYDVDGPVPRLLEESEINGVRSGRERVRKLIESNPDLTVRQLYMSVMAAGHGVVVGTAESIADQMEEWFLGHGCDGFNILPPYMPGPVYQVLDELLPELQRRGLFQTEYQGSTLRESLGLSRPEHSAVLRRRAMAPPQAVAAE